MVFRAKHGIVNYLLLWYNQAINQRGKNKMNTIAVLLSDLLLKKNIIIAEKKEIYTVGITLILSDIINFTIIKINT